MDTNDKSSRFSIIAATIAAAATILTWIAVAAFAAWIFWPRPAQAAEFSVTRGYVLPMFQRAASGVFVASASIVVIRPGYAVTVYHAVSRAELAENATTLEVVTGEGTFPLTVAATGPGFDLALVHSPALKCPCAPLGYDPVQDEPVVAVGFPRVRAIRQQWLTMGLVQSQGGAFIQHTAWLSTGNSGGGLFGYQQGRWVLVGLNRAIMIERQEFNNVGYAVPISAVQGFLDTVKELTQ
jgi:S1-C subfamily serine protease